MRPESSFDDEPFELSAKAISCIKNSGNPINAPKLASQGDVLHCWSAQYPAATGAMSDIVIDVVRWASIIPRAIADWP